MKKPSRGVCGTCGCPVVGPSLAQQVEALTTPRVWLNGHLYEEGKLVRVRCEKHMEDDDPRRGWGDVHCI